MKKRLSIFTLLVILLLVSTKVFAAIPSISGSMFIKTFGLSTANNTPVFTNAYLNQQGTSSPYRAYNALIYASDEIYVYAMNNTYALISYPTSSGRKQGYVRTSSLTYNNFSQNALRSRNRINTYTRPGGGSYGAIYNGDSVWTVARSGNYTQVVYPAGSVYKMAWITNNDYNNYIAPLPAPPPPLNSVINYPMKNMRCTWRSYSNMSWGSYNQNSSGRNYHLGIDVYGDNGYVYAMADGKIVASSSSNSGANGRFIVIEHNIGGKKCYSFYAHLKSLNVANGSVKSGQLIAVAGGSANGKDNYYGTHLHFAVVDSLWTAGNYYGYAYQFSGNKTYFQNVTYYNPMYVLQNKNLP